MASIGRSYQKTGFLIHLRMEQIQKWLIISEFAIGTSLLAKLLGRLLKLLLKHAAEAGAIGITNHKGNFSHGMLAFQQQLGSFVQANGGHKFMYRLIGERFYFAVKLGAA